MDVPEIVGDRLADESRLTSVSIGNDDRVYVTPSRTLIYHSAGLFSNESIDEYPHDAARFDVSAGRREASFAFEYDDGVRGFAIPSDRIETVLPPVIAGVLRSTGLIDDDEEIAESYRFGERTLVVTDRRLLTSVGEAVWDRDHESYSYDDVTDVGFEAGTLLVTIGGQQRRLDLAGEGDREAAHTVEDAVCAYHDVDTTDAIESPDTARFRPQKSSDDGGAGDRPADEVDDRSADEVDDRSVGEANDRSADGQPKHRSDDTRTQSPNTEVREAEANASTGQPSARAESDGDPQSTDDGGRSADADGRSSNALAEPRGTVADSTTAIDGATTDRAASAAVPGDGSSDVAAIVDGLDALREAVDRQTELIERQQETLDRLADRLDDE